MSTIQSSIRLNDGVTGPLRSMYRAMDTVINAFETMQNTSGNAVDVEAIRQARTELVRCNSEFEEMERNARGAGDSVGSLAQKAKSLVSALAGAEVLKQLVNLSDEMAGTEARLRLIVDDGGSVEALEEKIRASANRSRASYQSTADAVARLASNAGDAFANNDEIVQFAEIVNKQFTLAGTSATEASAAMLQLTQAMGSGVLRGDELNSIFEQAPTLIQSIASYLGVTVGEIRTLASEGKITADIVKNAMFASADEVNQKFEQMPMTWSQVFTTAGNYALVALQPLLSFINLLANNIDIIGPLVLGTAAAFAVLAVAANWVKLVTAATTLWTNAQRILNLVLSANPIALVIAAVAAFIGLIYAAVAAVNHFTGTSYSATGIIVGAFNVLLTFLYNTFLVTFQNVLAVVVNFLGNVFNNPIAAVKMAFYDMVLTVLGYIQKLAHGIESLVNAIPGVEVSITGGLDNLVSSVSAARESTKAASGWKEYMTKMERKDYSTAYQQGYTFGSNLGSSLSTTTDLTSGTGTTAAANLSSIADSVANTAADSADTASNTAAMKDSLEATSEDMKLLRDIVERQTVNALTNSTVYVEMTNNNQISSELDLDGVTSALAEGISEEVAKSADGTHE